jgi:chromosomal replication initiation ATPase DnaA
MFVKVDDVRQGSNRIALARIDAVVSARLGPSRLRGNAQPAALNRQIAMYLAHRVGGWSTTRIGRFYNGRDHSTVCHAIKRIQALRDANAEVEVSCLL